VHDALVAGLATTDDDLHDDLASFDSAGNPVFVTLPGAGFSATRLARLRRDFETVTFVFLTRSLTSQTACAVEHPQVRCIVPRLEAKDEDVFFAGYDRNWRLLRARCRKSTSS